MDVVEQKGEVAGTQVFVIKLGDQQIAVPSPTALKTVAEQIAAIKAPATTQVVKTVTTVAAANPTVERGIRGFPMAAMSKDDVLGEDYDPYDIPCEHAESFVVNGKVVYDGLWSTSREWHISVRGFYAGLKAKTFEDLPKCPTLWQDEGQYFEACAAVAYDGKRLLTGGALLGLLVYFPQLNEIVGPILKAFVGA